jgi:hypothetical protein
LQARLIYLATLFALVAGAGFKVVGMSDGGLGGI